MKTILRIPRGMRDAIISDLRRPHRFAAERIGFLFTRCVSDESTVVVAVLYEPVAEENYIDDPKVAARINSSAIRCAMQRALDSNQGVFHVHLHDHEGSPALSWVDQAEIPPLVFSFRNAAPNQAHGILVLSQSKAYAEILVPGANDLCPSPISLVGFPFGSFESGIAQLDKDLFSRQSFLGPESQQQIAACAIGIIGLGGGGSQIVQQLAHIGFRKFVMFDVDRIEPSNLNRLIGGTAGDVVNKTLKTKIAERLIKGIQTEAEVTLVSDRWQNAPHLFRSCDMVFGCIDSLRGRAEIEAAARRYLIPYIDIGLDVVKYETEPPQMAGQVILSMPGFSCMHCLGFLAPSRIQREAEQYGAAGARPQVVWANGVLASVAVGILVDLITDWTGDLRSTIYLSFDANRNTISEHPRLRFTPPLCTHFPLGEVGPPRFCET